MLGQYCYYGNKETIEEAKRRFESHVADDSNPIPADLRGVVFSAAMRNGDSTTFEQLVKV